MEVRGGGWVAGGQMNRARRNRGGRAALQINRRQKVGVEPPAAGEPEQRAPEPGGKSPKSTLRKPLLPPHAVPSTLLNIYIDTDDASIFTRSKMSDCSAWFSAQQTYDGEPISGEQTQTHVCLHGRRR